MQIEHVWIVLVMLIIAAELWAVTRVLKSSSKRDKKGLWIIVLIFIPLIGLLAWIFVGPKADPAIVRSGRE